MKKQKSTRHYADPTLFAACAELWFWIHLYCVAWLVCHEPLTIALWGTILKDDLVVLVKGFSILQVTMGSMRRPNPELTVP